MNPEAMGRAIADATRFLQVIHDDLHAQIGSLDRLLSDRGWKPLDPNRVGDSLGNSLNDGKLWVIDYLRRWYVPTATGGSADRVIGLVWYLYHLRESPYELPTLAAVAARLSSPQPVAGFTKENWELNAVFHAAYGRAEPVNLTPEQVRPFLPAARVATALVVPLCELTNAELLENRLIRPIHAAEERLSA